MQDYLQKAMPDVLLLALREQRELDENQDSELNDYQEDIYENLEADGDEHSSNGEDGVAEFFGENNVTFQSKNNENNDIVPLIND